MQKPTGPLCQLPSCTVGNLEWQSEDLSALLASHRQRASSLKKLVQEARNRKMRCREHGATSLFILILLEGDDAKGLKANQCIHKCSILSVLTLQQYLQTNRPLSMMIFMQHKIGQMLIINQRIKTEYLTAAKFELLGPDVTVLRCNQHIF